jgi:MAX dimerization protein
MLSNHLHRCEYNEKFLYSHLRNNHNELEKSRRAQLKSCLETLSEVVPMGNDTKQTTLGLLKRSRRYIKVLFTPFTIYV